MRSRHAQRRQTGDKRRAKSVTNQHENHHHINHHHYHRHNHHYHRHDDHMVISLSKAQSKKSSTNEHKHGLYAARPLTPKCIWCQWFRCIWYLIVPMQWDAKIPLREVKMLRKSGCNLIRRFFKHTKNRQWVVGDIILKTNRWILELPSKKPPKFQSFTFRAGKKGSNVC